MAKLSWVTLFGYAALGVLLTGCSIIPQSWLTNPSAATTTGTGIQVYPSSTSVALGQVMTFQASGGTPPYQYVASGDGTIGATGQFQAGLSTGLAQIQVSDYYGNSGSATVNVVQAGGVPNVTSLARGWSPTTPEALHQAPPVRGQVIAVEDRMTSNGKQVHSNFLATNLTHPVIRLDEEIEGKQTVAVRAVVEDQFLAKLLPGFTEADLRAVVAQAGARVSRQLGAEGTFLISMNQAPGISAEFIAARTRLKEKAEDDRDDLAQFHPGGG